MPLLGVTFVFRGVLAPLAHPMFTAMTGIGAAYAATHRRGGWALAVGLAGAMFLHGLWNGLTGLGLPGIILAYGLLACVLVVLITVIVTDRRRILGLVRRYLPAYQDSGLVTEADLQMLSTLRERRQARWWARATGGRPLARAVKAYQLAATELALGHERLHRGGATPGEFEERRRALIGVMGSAHQVIWGQGHGVAGPARHARPGRR